MRCRLCEQPVPVQRLLQGTATPGKMPPQPPDLGIVMTKRHKIGKSSLGMARRVPQDQMA